MTFPLGSVVELVMFAGTVMIGSVVSVTVTVTVKDPDEGLPCASVAEHVTVVGPGLKLLPELGEQLVATDPSTRSLAEGPDQVTVSGGESVETDMSAGMPLRAGPVVSTTVTSNGPPESQVTVVTPIGNSDPDAGSQVNPPSSNGTLAPPGPVASIGPTGSPKACVRADASGVPQRSANADTAISHLTLILGDPLFKL
jgi:hypothetical protein